MSLGASIFDVIDAAIELARSAKAQVDFRFNDVEFAEGDEIALAGATKRMRKLILAWGGTQVDGDEEHGTFMIKL